MWGSNSTTLRPRAEHSTVCTSQATLAIILNVKWSNCFCWILRSVVTHPVRNALYLEKTVFKLWSFRSFRQGRENWQIWRQHFPCFYVLSYNVRCHLSSGLCFLKVFEDHCSVIMPEETFTSHLKCYCIILKTDFRFYYIERESLFS